jgi:hypothetical protein
MAKTYVVLLNKKINKKKNNNNTMDSIIYVAKPNKKVQVIYKNYKYSRTSHKATKDGSLEYKCCTAKCGSTIKIINDEVILKNKKHNHDPLTDCNVAIIKNIEELKIKVCEDPTLDPKVWYAEIHKELLKIYDAREVAENWKNYDAIYDQIYYHRHRGGPKLPTKLIDIILSGKYTQTTSGKQFLRYDNEDDTKRELIFASDISLEILANSTKWHVDGTFQTCPKLFYQILTIHALYKDEMIACAYILLPDKLQTTYENVFEKINSIILEMHIRILVEEIMSDFEAGLLIQLAITFKQAKIKGCWFHFNQAIIYLFI